MQKIDIKITAKDRCNKVWGINTVGKNVYLVHSSNNYLSLI